MSVNILVAQKYGSNIALIISILRSAGSYVTHVLAIRRRLIHLVEPGDIRKWKNSAQKVPEANLVHFRNDFSKSQDFKLTAYGQLTASLHSAAGQMRPAVEHTHKCYMRTHLKVNF